VCGELLFFPKISNSPHTGLELYDHMIEYLEFAETALKDAVDAAGLRRALVNRFPDYGGLKVLDQQMRFLFRAAAPAPYHR
jgi:hypothetical protein